MSDKNTRLMDGFSWGEKLAMRGGLAAVVCLGAVAIFPSDPWMGVGYLVFVALGGLIVMYDALCVYCPYPYKHADCLFFPYQLVASVTVLRSEPIPWFKKALTALTFAGIVLIPQYWLWGNWLLFGMFWALTIAGGIAVPLHFCRRCRHRRCPMNLAKSPGPQSPA